MYYLYSCLVLNLYFKLQYLRKLNNFNSYLAVLSALDSAPIRRLEWHKQNAEVIRLLTQYFIILEFLKYKILKNF